ncbi:MAG: hypothetical protein NXI13_16310 [Proteobacteria bacterium]|nr:hypothetical protein [Pseudomonadota bacterium]
MGRPLKPRKAGSVEEAIDRTRINLGSEFAALVVDKSPSMVRRWGDGDDEPLPNVKQALALDKAHVSEGFGRPLITESMLREIKSEGLPAPANEAEDAIIFANIALIGLLDTLKKAKCPKGPGGTTVTYHEREELKRLFHELAPLIEEIGPAIEEIETNMRNVS